MNKMILVGETGQLVQDLDTIHKEVMRLGGGNINNVPKSIRDRYLKLVKKSNDLLKRKLDFDAKIRIVFSMINGGISMGDNGEALFEQIKEIHGLVKGVKPLETNLNHAIDITSSKLLALTNQFAREGKSDSAAVIVKLMESISNYGGTTKSKQNMANAKVVALEGEMRDIRRASNNFDFVGVEEELKRIRKSGERLLTSYAEEEVRKEYVAKINVLLASGRVIDADNILTKFKDNHSSDSNIPKLESRVVDWRLKKANSLDEFKIIKTGHPRYGAKVANSFWRYKRYHCEDLFGMIGEGKYSEVVRSLKQWEKEFGRGDRRDVSSLKKKLGTEIRRIEKRKERTLTQMREIDRILEEIRTA